MQDEPSSTEAAEYPFQIVQKKFKPVYVYRLPSNDEMCYRFFLNTTSKNHSLVYCACCVGMYKKMKQNKIPHPNAKKVCGCSIDTDPCLGHIEGCKPELYSNILGAFQQIFEQARSQEQYPFKIEKFAKTDTYLIIHRIKEDPTKCHRFMYMWCEGVKLIAVCGECRNIQVKIRKSPWKYTLTKDGFLEDPGLHHLPGCSPLLYDEVMFHHKLAGTKTVEQLWGAWMGERHDGVAGIAPSSCIIHSTITNGKPKEDFPCFVIERKQTFAYRMCDRSTHGYLFYQLDSTHLICSTCRSNEGKKTSSDDLILARKSDGFSMETDPMNGHLAHCDGLLNRKIWNGKSFASKVSKGNYGITRVNELLADYPLEKYDKGQKHFKNLIYRLAIDSSKCYRFRYSHYTFRTGTLYVACTSCSGILHNPGPKRKVKHEDEEPKKRRKTRELKMYACKIDGFLEDPAQGHLPDCNPIDYEQLMEDNVLLERELSKNFFKRRPGLSQAKHDSCSNEESNSREVFEQVYEVPFFTEDELDIAMINRTIVFKLERQVSAVGIESGYLRYSVELPETVDISTVQTTWTDGKMTLTAESKE